MRNRTCLTCVIVPAAATLMAMACGSGPHRLLRAGDARMHPVHPLRDALSGEPMPAPRGCRLRGCRRTIGHHERRQRRRHRRRNGLRLAGRRRAGGERGRLRIADVFSTADGTCVDPTLPAHCKVPATTSAAVPGRGLGSGDVHSRGMRGGFQRARRHSTARAPASTRRCRRIAEAAANTCPAPAAGHREPPLYAGERWRRHVQRNVRRGDDGGLRGFVLRPDRSESLRLVHQCVPGPALGERHSDLHRNNTGVRGDLHHGIPRVQRGLLAEHRRAFRHHRPVRAHGGVRGVRRADRERHDRHRYARGAVRDCRPRDGRGEDCGVGARVRVRHRGQLHGEPRRR